jgi:hypothetical protein
MSDLEGRLESAHNLWPDAATEKVDIAKHRESYATALKYRKDLGQIVRNKRAMRNAAKEAYITKYVEITSRIAAEFPRDTTMHDLFFDDARTKSALAEADEDENVESSDDENTGDNKPG